MGKRKVSEEDKQALADLVREEIGRYKRGEIKRLSKNPELAELLGCSNTYIPEILRNNLDSGLRTERQRIISKNLLAHSSEPAILIENRRRAGRLAYTITLAHRTMNQKIEHGKRVYKKGLVKICPSRRMEIYEKGLGKLTTEQRRANWRKGFGKKSFEEMSENGKKAGRLGGLIGGLIGGSRAAEVYRKNAYFVEQRFHASSQQEGAVALMLENYLPRYQIKEGRTFQVRDKGINNGGIDFLVDSEFLEWHPIELYHGRRGDIPSKEEDKSYRSVLESLSENERKEFQKEYKKVLAINYRNSRQEAIDSSGYAGRNITSATNVKELYDFIAKYSDSLPSFNKFRKEFNQKVKYVKSFAIKKEKPARVVELVEICATD